MGEWFCFLWRGSTILGGDSFGVAQVLREEEREREREMKAKQLTQHLAIMLTDMYMNNQSLRQG